VQTLCYNTIRCDPFYRLSNMISKDKIKILISIIYRGLSVFTRGLYKKIKALLVSPLFYLPIIFIGLVLTLFTSVFWSLTPPTDFESGQVVSIETGSSLDDVARDLQSYRVIRSPFWFRAFVIAFDGEYSVPAGDYYFNEPMSVWQVAYRLSQGNFGQDPIRITIPEGWNIFRIAEALEDSFEHITAKEVVELGREGYLFPDTYFFRPNANATEVVNKMKHNFEVKTSQLQQLAQERAVDFNEVVIMASILETEANTEISKRKIADILWRRLEIGMPLQVDAAFSYVNGKNSYQLTLKDLRTDHPYNTYTRTGLPPTPIANPGLVALEAALEPIDTDFLYFLSDLSGNMYYARDFDEHQFNRENYLRR